MGDTAHAWYLPPFGGPVPQELYYPGMQYVYVGALALTVAAMFMYFKTADIKSPTAPPSWLPTKAMLFSPDWSPRQQYVIVLCMVNMFLLQTNCMGQYNPAWAIYQESDKGLGNSPAQVGMYLGATSFAAAIGIPLVIWLMGKVGVVWAVFITSAWMGQLSCMGPWWFATMTPACAIGTIGCMGYSCEIISMLNRISRFVPVDDMPRVMGLIGCAQTIGQIIFLNVGTWIWHYGPQIVFFVQASSYLVVAYNTFVAFSKDDEGNTFEEGQRSPEVMDGSFLKKWLNPFMIWVILAYVLMYGATEWSAPVYWPRMVSLGITQETISAVRSVNIVWNVITHLILGVHLSGKGPTSLLRWACGGVLLMGAAFVAEGPHPMLQGFVELVTPLKGTTVTLLLSLGLTNLLFVLGQALLTVTVMPLMRNALASSSGADTWSSNTLAPGVDFACQAVGAGIGAALGGNMATSMGFAPACSAMAGFVVAFAIVGLLVHPPQSKMKGTTYGSSV